MDYNNNHPTSSDLFEYDPISLDDELMQLLSSVSPQNLDVSDVLTTLIDENQGQYTSSHNNHMMTFSNSNPIHASIAQVPQHNNNNNNNNVVEFNFTSAPAPAPAPAPSKDEVRKKKSKAVEVERKRRQDMASLYQELRSLLPPGVIKKRRSISDLLEEAANHITNTEVGIKGLSDKKDELLRIMRSTAGSSRPSGSSTNSNNNISSKEQQSPHHVTVKACKDGLIEVIVSTSALSEDDDHENNNNNNRGFRLSKMLRLLGEEGLNVINCFSARVDTKLVHTIQAQVDDGRGIDLCLLQQTLMDHL